jgi:hypothetical protein
MLTPFAERLLHLQNTSYGSSPAIRFKILFYQSKKVCSSFDQRFAKSTAYADSIAKPLETMASQLPSNPICTDPP